MYNDVEKNASPLGPAAAEGMMKTGVGGQK